MKELTAVLWVSLDTKTHCEQKKINTTTWTEGLGVKMELLLR